MTEEDENAGNRQGLKVRRPDGSLETIRADHVQNRARLIGDYVCGQNHQMGRGASFGGLLNCCKVLKKLLRGTTRLNLAALPF